MSLLGRLAACAAVGLLANAAWAADEALVLRQRAEQLAAADRCEEALPRAQRARELDASDARAALIEGRCLLRLGRYREAIAPLSDARDLDPSLEGVSTDLAQCHYHLDELTAARAELDRAEAQNPDDARMLLYRGLVLSREAKQSEAAAAFDRAGSLDRSLAGVAGLYSGRTWAAMREREKAAAAFERARSAAPGSEWAREAELELARLEALDEKHYWAQLRGGFEYDDNPAQRIAGSADSLNTSLFGPFTFDEQDDVTGIFEGELGAELLRDPDNSLGAIAGYDGSAHIQHFDELDLQYPWLSLWYDRRLGEDTWVRLQPFGGYAWLGAEPYVAHGGGLVGLNHDFTDAFTGQLFTRINVNDFRFRIEPDQVLTVIDATLGTSYDAEAHRRRNRDGFQTDVGAEGRYEWVASGTTLRLGSSYERYQAEGEDWSLHGNRSWLGVHQRLPLDLFLNVAGSFTYHDYDHRSSYLPANEFVNGFGPKRRDRIYQAEAELGYPVTDWLIVSARYQYTNDDSNTRVFDYERQIAGGYITLSWEK